MAHRQPGSSFKPFVYATAIDSGKFTPARIVNDAPEVFDEFPQWKPKNYETGRFEGPVRLRYALSKSINTVSLLKSTGFPAYDNKIQNTIQKSWSYRPIIVSGKATPVCTAVRFVYRQK